jgi:hypothetical protein
MEAQVLAGPDDDELPALLSAGYVLPRSFETEDQSRLAWELHFADQISRLSASRGEQRVWVFARELTHEYLDILNALLIEYRVTFDAIAGGDPATRRARIMQFSERIPTLSIAAEMKLEIFRNRGRTWTWNMLRDIDALSMAVPYCRAVVTDRDALDLLHRTQACVRCGTEAISDLQELPALLLDLRTEAQVAKDEWPEWEGVEDSGNHVLVPPPPLASQDSAHAMSVRIFDKDGNRLTRPS